MFLFEQSPTNIKYLLPYSIITTFIMGKCSKTIAHLCRGRDINYKKNIIVDSVNAHVLHNLSSEYQKA